MAMNRLVVILRNLADLTVRRAHLLLLKRRNHIISALFISVVLPNIIRNDVRYIENFNTETQRNTLIACVLSILIGFYFFSNMRKLSTKSALSHLFSSFSLTFSISLSIFVLLRLEYARVTFVLAYFMSVLWLSVLLIIERRWANRRYAIVPGGHVDDLLKITGVEWMVLEEPILPDGTFLGVVVDLRANLTKKWEKFIADSAVRGTPVYHYKQIKESITGQVEIDHLSENYLGSLMPTGVYAFAKSTVDRIAAFLLIVPLFVVILAAAIAIKIDSHGPVFFRQQRIGFRGRSFYVWKLRTMVATEAPSGDVGGSASALTAVNDPRVTRVGRFLRRWKIDELPQIVNVLRGEMSWIGPRPESAEVARWFESHVPFYRYRQIVKPGITGWAQINLGYVSEASNEVKKLRYDFFYIKNLSFWIDFIVFLRTFAVIFTGFGAR